MMAPVTADGVETITPREAEVLAAVGSRMTNAQIAARLHLSVRTVESHVAALLRKSGVANRQALAEMAPHLTSGQQLGAGIKGLPSPWTSLVGRQAEVAEVREALAANRLLTLVGPGGVGKSRLAMEVARSTAAEFPYGGAFVELVPVRPGYLAQSVATVLGVADQPGSTVEQTLHAHLVGRRVLIVLDNCEHVLEAAADLVAGLLTACPEATVLAMSRERLGVTGERLVRVGPLPTAAGGPGHSDAERLFVERARAADPSFADDSAVVAALCARLDGLPLAIELAAARVASVGPAALLAATGDRLRLLTGIRGAPERHRSLRAVLDWSYELLVEPDRRLLRRLGVFAGGFDLAAVAAVAADGDTAAAVDGIGRLVDKSMVMCRRDRDATWWQLLETVRSYAVDQLEARHEADASRARHREWAAGVAAALLRRRGLPGWEAEFDRVGDDLREALRTAPPGPDRISHELAWSTGHLAFARGRNVEARRHFEECARRSASATEVADVLRVAAQVAQADSRTAVAFELLVGAAAAVGEVDGALQAICLAQAVVHATRFAGCLAQPMPNGRLRDVLDDAQCVAPPVDRAAQAWLAVAEAWMTHGEPLAPGLAEAEAALVAARAVDEPILLSAAMDGVSAALLNAERYRDAFRLNRERMELLSRLDRRDPRGASEFDDTISVLIDSGCAAGELGETLAAVLPLSAGVAGPRQQHAAQEHVVLLALTGRFDEAARDAERLWSDWIAAGKPFAGWMVPPVLAVVLTHGLRGHASAQEEWLRRAAELARSGDPLRDRIAGAFATFVLARIALHMGDVAAAAALTATTCVIHPLRGPAHCPTTTPTPVLWPPRSPWSAALRMPSP
jgi:predicted ATPase/DNA-binding CsgD family transcriptional regulator